jgi:hypothetical protein
MLDELIHRYRSGEMTLSEFVETAAAHYQPRQSYGYPETDGGETARTGVSNVTITAAVMDGELTREEAEAIYAAIPMPV